MVQSIDPQEKSHHLNVKMYKNNTSKNRLYILLPLKIADRPMQCETIWLKSTMSAFDVDLTLFVKQDDVLAANDSIAWKSS